MNPIIIRRRKKHEAEQAVKDLEERGFTLVFPITEQTKEGKRFTTDSLNRKIFQENTFSTCWVAKLRRV